MESRYILSSNKYHRKRRHDCVWPQWAWREAFYTFCAAQQARLTIIKLLLNSQDVICFARYSVYSFNIQSYRRYGVMGYEEEEDN